MFRMERPDVTVLFDVLFRVGRIARRSALWPESVNVRGSVSRDAWPGGIRTPNLRLADSAVTLGAEGHLKAGFVAVGCEDDIEESGENEWHGREYTAALTYAQAETGDGAH